MDRSCGGGRQICAVRKTLATSADGVREQIEACKKHGVSLMEAFMYRFHPQTRRVQQLIASGAIGQVREVRAHLSVNIMGIIPGLGTCAAEGLIVVIHSDGNRREELLEPANQYMKMADAFLIAPSLPLILNCKQLKKR
jgi:hypothetical protein